MLQTYLDDPNILCIYAYGSRVYGTHHPESDYDFIMVSNDNNPKQEHSSGKYNISIYNKDDFLSLIQQHEISILECLFLPEAFIFKQEMVFPFSLNKEQLRKSISAKCSNSWVKAKKKLVVEKDYDPYIAKKSLFHSLRLFLFGTQIAEFGKIVDYSAANRYYSQIFSFDSTIWNVYQEFFQPIFNQLKSNFKKFCPK